MSISQRRLQEMLRYESETGQFVWLVQVSNLKPGARAGYIHATGKAKRKYIKIRIAGKNYAAHRLAWLYMTGEFPPSDIDHIDGDGTNNCWRNLRSASRSQNMANVDTAPRGKSGYRGVTVSSRGRFLATIRVHGKQTHLGSFDTAEEAHHAYCEKARAVYGEFTNV